MLQAEQINLFLESFYDFAEGDLGPLSSELGPSELLKTRSSYGSVIFGALVTGDLQGKMTLVLDWNTSIRIAEGRLSQKLDSFTPEAMEILTDFFYRYAEHLATLFATRGTGIELRPMPMLTDTHFLMAEENVGATLKLPVTTKIGTFTFFLSFE